MSTKHLRECSFLIPVRGDDGLSSGELHSAMEWEWLEDQLWQKFGAGTEAPGLYTGFYPDPDTGERVSDESRRYIVALADDRLDDLRDLLRECCDVFSQKCIYLSIAGEVEFIQHPTTP